MRMPLFRNLPLSRKIILGIIPLFLLFVALSVILQNHFQEKEMMEQAQRSAHTYADIIRESLVSMMVNNLEVDESFLSRVNGIEQFDTLHILINDLRLRDELLTPKRVERLATKHRTLLPHDDIEENVLKEGRAVFLRDGDHFRGVVPFNATEVCQKCHAVPVGYTLGATDLHISLANVSEATAGNWRRSFFIFLAFTALAIGVASVMFTSFVSAPIARLVTAAREIARGNLDFRVHPDDGAAEQHSADELSFLARQFNDMRIALREKIHQLDQLNQNLSVRNREVEDALDRLRQAQEDLVRTERLAVTGRMTAQLSHEINNPIHNIQSLLESTLKKMNGDGKARELIGVALEEVGRMAQLTRQMLDYYRGSVVEAALTPVSVRDILHDIVRVNSAVLEQKNVRLETDLPDDLPVVLGVADKLKQVFLNLVLNARDAMPDGGTLRLAARHDTGTVEIVVADTGVGISPDHLGRIFDAFFTTKEQVSGVGLGLFVTYGIIQQHGGTIHVASTVGEGTTFTIILPAAGETHE